MWQLLSPYKGTRSMTLSRLVLRSWPWGLPCWRGLAGWHDFFHGVPQPLNSHYQVWIKLYLQGQFLVKNRTDETLYLTTSKLIRPRIRGEVLPGLLITQSANGDIYGTAYVSGYFIPPQATLSFMSTIHIRGVPRQKSDTMDAVLEIADANANKQRVRLKIKGQRIA